MDKDKDTSMDKDTSPTRLIPVPDWPKHHPWPSEHGLRAMIREASENGFDKVIRRYGRRILIDERAFFAWVEELRAEREAEREATMDASRKERAPCPEAATGARRHRPAALVLRRDCCRLDLGPGPLAGRGLGGPIVTSVVEVKEGVRHGRRVFRVVYIRSRRVAGEYLNRSKALRVAEEYNAPRRVQR